VVEIMMALETFTGVVGLLTFIINVCGIAAFIIAIKNDREGWRNNLWWCVFFTAVDLLRYALFMVSKVYLSHEITFLNMWGFAGTAIAFGAILGCSFMTNYFDSKIESIADVK
jgi:hypothetical protein